MTAAPPESPPLLRLRGVTKRFEGVIALDGVGFELERGEIHALLGENGAGKSTLIKVLAGIHRPDAGLIEVEGRAEAIESVAHADRLGIRVIHQELSLAPNLSIAENIYLGREPGRLGCLRRRKMEEDAEALVVGLGLREIRSVRTIVSRLSLAHRQLVEIARALSRQARILILDEPTSSLSEVETEALFSTLRRLRGQGTGIIYISHRLEEILRLADRITVLRDGRVAGTQKRAAVSQKEELVRSMVGRDLVEYFQPPAERFGEVALEVSSLSSRSVKDVSLTVRAGEILGIAGLVGSGRSELARALFGIDPIAGGEIRVEGKRVAIKRPRDALKAGIVLVPEDRKLEGLVMIQSLAFNLALPWTSRWCRGAFPDLRARSAIVRRAMESFAVKASSPEQPISRLSGGNQQKALVGRWMEERPKVLILDEPTRGVDVGARKEMFTILGSLVESGMAVLLISSDLLEVLSLSHRIALYKENRILRTARRGELGLEDVMARLTGAKSVES